MVKDILISFLMLLFVVFLVLAAGLGVGAVLHWVLPVIDLGMATLIGLIAFCTGTYAFIKFMNDTPPSELPDDDFDEVPRIVLESYPFRKSRRRKAKKTA